MFPKKGKDFPETNVTDRYAAAIAAALRAGHGDTHQAIKTVMRWTGANERTVKNWFVGTNGPSGVHLISLVRHSDLVLEVLLQLAGREHSIAVAKLISARKQLTEILELTQVLVDKISASQARETDEH
jgi:pyocin large subunit-like protein